VVLIRIGVSVSTKPRELKAVSKQEPARGYAVLSLLALAVIWGYNWVMMKVGVSYSPPFDFAAMRAFFGALCLFLVMIGLRRPLMPQEIPGTFLLGILQTGGVLGLSMWALVSGGAGKTAILNYTMPFWVLLFAWIFLGERLRGMQWLSVGLALGGLLFILMPLSLSSDLTSKGLALLSGISWALSAIVAKKLQHKASLDLLSLTAWQMLFGSLPLILVSLLVPAPPINWSIPFIAALIYNVIPGNAIAWVLWLYALNRLSAGTAGLGMLATPVIGVLAAWVQLGEQPGLTESVGLVLIITALACNSIQALRPQH
jgi:drug/metabolite transporter (DMT)-like permease